MLHLEDFLFHNQSCSSLRRSNDSKKDSFDICSNADLKVRKIHTHNVLCNCRFKICPLGHEYCMGILCSACDISTSNVPCNHPCCYKQGKEFSCCDAGDGPRQPKQSLASINEQARLQRKESLKNYRKRSSVVLGKGKGFSSCIAGDGPKKNNTVGGYRLISNDPLTLRKRNRNRDRMQRIRAASNMEAVPQLIIEAVPQINTNGAPSRRNPKLRRNRRIRSTKRFYNIVGKLVKKYDEPMSFDKLPPSEQKIFSRRFAERAAKLGKKFRLEHDLNEKNFKIMSRNKMEAIRNRRSIFGNDSSFDEYRQSEILRIGNISPYINETYGSMTPEERMVFHRRLVDNDIIDATRIMQLINYDYLSDGEKRCFIDGEMNPLLELELLLFFEMNCEERNDFLSRECDKIIDKGSKYLQRHNHHKQLQKSLNRVTRDTVNKMFCPSFVESNDGLPASVEHRRLFESNIHMARQVFWENTGNNDLNGLDLQKLPRRVDVINATSSEVEEYISYFN